jgi:hypothetical protein
LTTAAEALWRQCLNQGETRKLILMVSKPVPAAAEALRVSRAKRVQPPKPRRQSLKPPVQGEKSKVSCKMRIFLLRTPPKPVPAAAEALR